MDLTGKVIAIMEARGGVSARTGNPWMTQEYVIEIPGQYPRKMVFNIFGEDKIKQFNIQPGEEITVQFMPASITVAGSTTSVLGTSSVARLQVPYPLPLLLLLLLSRALLLRLLQHPSLPHRSLPVRTLPTTCPSKQAVTHHIKSISNRWCFFYCRQVSRVHILYTGQI